MAIKISKYEAPTAANPYAQDVADLIAAGEDVAGSITVETAKVKNAALKFRQAANAADKTAKELGTHDNGDGTTDITFRLVPRYKKGANADPKPDADAVEAPAEDTAKPVKPGK